MTVARNEVKSDQKCKPQSSSYGGNGNQDGQEVLVHPDSNNHDGKGNEESLSGASKEK